MKALHFCLVLVFVGLCHSLSPYSRISNKLPSSHPRHTRQATRCEDCTLPETSTFVAGCTATDYLQGRVDISALCGDNTGAIVRIARCSQNENGQYCNLLDFSPYETVRTTCANQVTNCSMECRSALLALRSSFGCCISYMNITALGPSFGPATEVVFAGSLWSLCNVEGVDTPCPEPATFTPVENPLDCTTPTEDVITEVNQRMQDLDCSTAAEQFLEIIDGQVCTRPEANNRAQTCGRSSTGIYCGLVDGARRQADIITNQCSGNCSSECREALMAAKSASGCCVNNFLNTTIFESFGFGCTTFYQRNSDLWERCGVTSPGFCPISFGSSAKLTAFSLTIVVMAITGLIFKV